MDRLRRSMRTRVSTVLVLLLVLPALMGCFGDDAKPPAKVDHPFGFEEAIASGVWYHIGGGPDFLMVRIDPRQEIVRLIESLKYEHRAA